MKTPLITTFQFKVRYYLQLNGGISQKKLNQKRQIAIALLYNSNSEHLDEGLAKIL